MGIWTQASGIAATTPADRNRYVDFLRAVSILFVISGHWLITGAFFDVKTNTFTPVLALEVLPWTVWLTWLFQVMPVFFVVGGYANAVSLEGARDKGAGYAEWLTGRLHRLLTPLLLLVLVWAGISFAMYMLGASPELISYISRTALVPTWFLAIYTMIVLLAPVTYALWRRWGLASLLAYVLLTVLADIAFFQFQWKAPGWSNYLWVWLAMHHLGFAWRDGRLGNPLFLVVFSLGSLLLLMALIFQGPYPIAMAGSPGGGVSNTLPPKVTLIALGLFQFGILLAIEKPMQRWLSGIKAWTCTVVINSMIMTIYLWHMTLLLLLLGVARLSGGIGLTMQPGTAEWWWTRPVWMAVLSILLIPVALALSPLERTARAKDAPALSTWRLVVGATMAGLGITLTALLGLTGDPFSVANTGIVTLVLGGAWVCGLSVRLS